MRYLLAILLPPAAVFACRQPKQLPANVLLTLCLWLPGVIHALVVVHQARERERADRVANVVLAREERLVRSRQRRAIPLGRLTRARLT
jgi:uncharacterized membrane protein YqaE (UPF0057 family)